jgi:hypothetical protein
MLEDELTPEIRMDAEEDCREEFERQELSDAELEECWAAYQKLLREYRQVD